MADACPQLTALDRGLGGAWLLLAQIDAVATSITLVLDNVNLGAPLGEAAPAAVAHRAALLAQLARAESLASAAASLAQLAQQRLDGMQALLRAGP